MGHLEDSAAEGCALCLVGLFELVDSIADVGERHGVFVAGVWLGESVDGHGEIERDVCYKGRRKRVR